MTGTTTRRRTGTKAATTTANATPAKQQNARVSLGTLFETKNENFHSGPIAPSDGRYANQADFLEMLPEAPTGFAWRLKAFTKETRSGALVTDVVAECEPLQR